ncbi:MAG TPA: zinc-binding dehydrogenase [Chitinophagales bacterium]|nr:zinc-binding dehydrogenase [Chitinophagales bacterium]
MHTINKIFIQTKKYNLIIDTHGNLFHSDFIRMGERGVVNGFVGMQRLITLPLKSAFSKFHLAQFTAQINTTVLEILSDLIKNEKIKVHIDKVYSYEKIPEAIDYIEAMRTKGQVAMVLENGNKT